MILIIFLIMIVTAAFSLGLFLRLAPQFGGKVKENGIQRLNDSHQFKNGQFVNIENTQMKAPNTSLFEIMREFISGGPDRSPSESIPQVKVDLNAFDNLQSDHIEITWLGHSSVLIGFEGSIILTDPMFGKRASPFLFMGPRRFNDNLPLALKDIPCLDAVIISHDHYDHLDYKTIVALSPKTKRFYMPLGVGAHLQRWGVDSKKIVELDWWEEIEFTSTIKFVATPSRHFSGRGPGDRNKTLWASWVIKSSKHNLYFCGDSGYSQHFTEIGKKYGPFDLTMLECGAYSRYWPFIHMLPEETAQAHLDLQGKVLLPIHWAQFNLSLHPWNEPIQRLLKEAKQENITVATPKIGESFFINEKIPSRQWWNFSKQFGENNVK